jgi:hypothetical protein
MARAMTSTAAATRRRTSASQRCLTELSAGRAALGAVANLTDGQLETVSPASEMNFCDGQRTLEQVVTNLLNHQSHQLDALKSAIS